MAQSEMARRLPPPWKVEKIPGGYVVRDANGQALAYVYSRATETDAIQAKVLTDDEARRVAANTGCRSCWGTRNEDRAQAGSRRCRTLGAGTHPVVLHRERHGLAEGRRDDP
jgi:hypothetical protein